MSEPIPLDLLAFLVLSAMVEAFRAFPGGPLVVLWSFQEWWQKTTWTMKGPRRSSGEPRGSKKGPKDQKDHASNMRTDGER